MNIYIANINYKASDADLKELFAQYGTVTSAKIIRDKNTKQSRGFGFVEMSDDDAANTAIRELDNTDFMERQISVKEANARPERR